MKTASKRALPKTAEVTGDLIGNKTADEITSVSKKYSKDYIHRMRMNQKLQKKDIY